MNELDFAEALENPEKEYDYKANIELEVEEGCFAPHRVVGPARLEIKYFTDYDANLHLKGYVIVPFEFVCDRCASTFERNLFLDVDEVICPRMSEDSELTYNMPRIELDDIITSFVICAFPSKVLCREDCKGLCATCGANLNDGDCGCKN